MQGPGGTLYEGESFTLGFKFGPKYPFDSPEVRLEFSTQSVTLLFLVYYVCTYIYVL